MKLLLLLLPLCVFGFSPIEDAIGLIFGRNATSGAPLGPTDYEELAKMKSDMVLRAKRQASVGHILWPNKKLTFYFDGLDEVTKTSVRTAHKLISSHTCIDFEEKKQAKEVVRVYSGKGCGSDMGFAWDDDQVISLGQGCQVMGTAAHEFMHALGVYHMQSRSDRDKYITINKGNIPDYDLHNYDILKEKDNYLFTPYEYGSVMHYGARDHAKIAGKLSIVPTPGNEKYLHTMGGGQISFYDYKMLNFYYECNNTCKAATSAKCQNGGYPNPRNCAICNCPGGYGGDLCDQRPPGCGEMLTATADWKTAQFAIGNSNDKSYRKVPTVCNSWITAPAGKEIEVSITKMDNPQCNYGCKMNGIEIKAEDKLRTNPRYCCPEFNNQVIRSVLNPTPVISYNRYMGSTFVFKYRYVDTNVATTKAPTVPVVTKPQPPVVPAKTDLKNFMVPLKRFYNKKTWSHRFHTSLDYEKTWKTKGFMFDRSLGNVISTSLYQQNKAEIEKECGPLDLVQSFIGTYAIITPNPSFAKTLTKKKGYFQYEDVGYCSKTPKCGAMKPLRAVIAKDKKNSVYSTDQAEINTLNKQTRYKGSASGVVCYLF